MKLKDQNVVETPGSLIPLSHDDALAMHEEVSQWKLKDIVLERSFEFKGFEEAMDFVNKVAKIAQQQNHHPDIHIYYNKVALELSTHKINNLTEHDFILAAKINSLIGE